MEEQTAQRRTAPYTYESSEIFLSMVQAEYQNEIERASSIDTKLSISLPIIATYLFSIVQYSGLQNLLNLVERAEAQSLVLIFVYGLSLILAGIACALMVRSTVAHQYETVQINKLNSAQHMSLPREQYCALVSIGYMNAAFRNALKNDRRGQLHMLGWINAAASLAFFGLYALAVR